MTWASWRFPRSSRSFDSILDSRSSKADCSVSIQVRSLRGVRRSWRVFNEGSLSNGFALDERICESASDFGIGGMECCRNFFRVGGWAIGVSEVSWIDWTGGFAGGSPRKGIFGGGGGVDAEATSLEGVCGGLTMYDDV